MFIFKCRYRCLCHFQFRDSFTPENCPQGKWPPKIAARRILNHKDIKHIFTIVNDELVNIKNWFTSGKLSLSVETTKYSFSLRQVRLTENKIASNIRILYKARPYLHKRFCFGSTTHIFTST